MDITREARAILDAVGECGGRFGAVTIAELLCGKESERVLRWNLDRRHAFGLLSHLSVAQVRERIRFLTQAGYLDTGGGEYPVLIPGPRARELSGRDCTITMRQRSDGRRSDRAAARGSSAPAAPPDEALFQQLRALRSELARKKSLPAYVIFTDRTLREMAARKPSTLSELERIPGVGSRKLAQYGKQFLAVLRCADTPC